MVYVIFDAHSYDMTYGEASTQRELSRAGIVFTYCAWTLAEFGGRTNFALDS